MGGWPGIDDASQAVTSTADGLGPHNHQAGHPAILGISLSPKVLCDRKSEIDNAAKAIGEEMATRKENDGV
ncbi:unnamed protein product [Toxocara canis]|uniref:Transcriptional regulator n=1 Tax=Toxocara canis TaxID=6265 RepID=A0A183USK5_TOXCA|nr:unnamed protein product [Toxocara canis]